MSSVQSRHVGNNKCTEFYRTRVRGQIWPDTLLLGINLCLMSVSNQMRAVSLRFPSVTLYELLVQIPSVSYLLIAVSLGFLSVSYW